MNKTSELLCAHSGLVFAGLMGLGIFGIAGWLPPVSPLLDADGVTAMFEQDRMRIRVGMSIAVLAAVFFWPFTAAIAAQTRRIEGEFHPLTYVQIMASAGTTMVVMISAYIWLAMAYRPEAPAGAMQLVNDYAWITFIGAWPPLFLQNLAVVICILTDKSPVKRYPRWLAYACIWIDLIFVTGALIPFFMEGPFTWRGLIAFWMVATAFFGWIILMWWMTVRAINKHDDYA